MKLELKHLAPYLPYGLKIQGWEKKIKILKGLEKQKEHHYYASFVDEKMIEQVWIIRPILRPLSDLTKEEKEQIWGKGRVYVGTATRDSDEGFYPDWLIPMRYAETYGCLELRFRIIEQLLEKHIDIFGLIPKGLAININTL